jgi:hypothetical protein
MNIMLNGVMQAIAESSTAIDILNDITNAQMDWIRQQVNNHVKDVFSAALSEVKGYLIISGLIVAGLMLIIIILLMKKALG